MTPQRPSAGRHLPAALRLVPMATRYFAGATQAAGGAAGSACRLGGAPPPFLYACARSRPRKCSRGALTRRRAGAGVGRAATAVSALGWAPGRVCWNKSLLPDRSRGVAPGAAPEVAGAPRGPLPLRRSAGTPG